jgi:hypothetical protein
MNVKQWMIGASLLLACGLANGRDAIAVNATEVERSRSAAEWLMEYLLELESKSLSTYLEPASSNSGGKAIYEEHARDGSAPTPQEMDRTIPMWD